MHEKGPEIGHEVTVTDMMEVHQCVGGVEANERAGYIEEGNNSVICITTRGRGQYGSDTTSYCQTIL
jgi:hypothetical protein